MEKLLTMSKKEPTRLEIMQRLEEKRKADPHLAHCLLPDTQA